MGGAAAGVCKCSSGSPGGNIRSASATLVTLGGVDKPWALLANLADLLTVGLSSLSGEMRRVFLIDPAVLDNHSLALSKTLGICSVGVETCGFGGGGEVLSLGVTSSPFFFFVDGSRFMFFSPLDLLDAGRVPLSLGRVVACVVSLLGDREVMLELLSVEVPPLVVRAPSRVGSIDPSNPNCARC